jgi:hypothetical protein
MGIAITFRDKTKHERRQNKYDDSFFDSSEAEPLPRLIQFETPAFCSHYWTRIDTNFEMAKS